MVAYSYSMSPLSWFTGDCRGRLGFFLVAGGADLFKFVNVLPGELNRIQYTVTNSKQLSADLFRESSVWGHKHHPIQPASQQASKPGKPGQASQVSQVSQAGQASLQASWHRFSRHPGLGAKVLQGLEHCPQGATR